ncbi:MAG: glycosyltransferase, partial [Steroidobacteraceae bacterium]
MTHDHADGIKSGPASLTAIILAFNEHLHIRRCIENVRQVASHVVVIDSGSIDDTVAIAQSLGANVLSNPFVNH